MVIFHSYVSHYQRVIVPYKAIFGWYIPLGLKNGPYI